ncbi:MAG: YesL family protein [Lachnospiraceae bacterium]|nr:YesL family protein [Lachnospiraceae bacterium]
MNKFFDIDGPFIVGLTKVADVFILNLLFILCSIPIITIGPAMTAMYYVTLKMVKDEDCYIVRGFFKSFKQNLRQGIVIWVIMAIVGAIMYFDSKFMNGYYSDIVAISDNSAKVMGILVLAALVLYLFTISYVFPVLARFDNSIKNTIKNALIMSIRHLPSTIAIVLINVLPLLLVYAVPRAFILLFVIFGISAYCNSSFFVKIFKNYMPEETIVSDENFEINMEE